MEYQPARRARLWTPWIESTCHLPRRGVYLLVIQLPSPIRQANLPCSLRSDASVRPTATARRTAKVNATRVASRGLDSTEVDSTSRHTLASGLYPGIYVYVGSAQRNLLPRLRRHACRHKTQHWHIDYLTTRGSVLGAWVMEADKSAECTWAKALAASYPLAIPRFGASDCRCAGHLFACSAAP